MLKLDQIHSYYGKSHILNGVNLVVKKGELVTLLGRNGMGKTTTLKSIMGMVSVRSGSVLFKENNITNQPSYQIYRQGIGYVPQGRHIFSTLTVEEICDCPRLIGMKKTSIGCLTIFLLCECGWTTWVTN